MANNKAVSERRMGPAGSENWHAMLDAAELILREEGHAELTSRRIAEHVGVKQRLVYYYFRTMDELIVAMFRRSSERDLSRLREESQSADAIRNLWQLAAYDSDARLISEYMALANRIPELREEVIKFIEEARAVQVEVLTAAISKKKSGKNDAALPPEVLVILGTAVGLLLNREEQLGVKSGHEQIKTLLEAFIGKLSA